MNMMTMIVAYILVAFMAKAVLYFMLFSLEHNTFAGFNRRNRREEELLGIINDLSGRVSNLETIIKTAAQIDDKDLDQLEKTLKEDAS